MRKFFLIAIFSILATSCITQREVRYFQPSESLQINEEGLIPYNYQPYRITKNDILNLHIVTTPKGDAAQFYSDLNTKTPTGTGNVSGESTNARQYYNGLKVDFNGDIHVFGIGYIKAEGRTLQEVSQEIQERVDENFLEGKSEVRLTTDGITYYILGDVETTGLTGAKKSYKNTLNLSEALATEGGLNRSVDRKNIVIHRKYPEGIKIVHLDLTREDAMNSPYYWLQNGDEIYLSTRGKNLNGFGATPMQTLTQGVSILTTLMSIYLILDRL